MKVCEVIDNYNIERPNDVSDDRKLRYITNLERLVFTEIILTHKLDEKTKDYILDVVEAYEKEQALLEDEANDDEVIKLFFKDKKDDIDIDTYFKAFNYDTELMADGIYSQLYMHYIDQQIASAENEPKRYNASTTMYNNAYITFQDYWNRTHMPLSRPLQVAHHQDRVGKDVFPPVAKDDSPAVKKLKEIIKKVLLELHLSEAIIKIFVNGYEKPVDNGTVEIDVPTKVSELDNDKEYVTKDSLVGLAKVTDIPTDVSAFNNDAGYLTAHQDISGKQNKLTPGKNVTIINDVISADASGDVDYDEINNKPSINGVELVGNKTSDDLKLETGKVDGVKVNGVLQTIANRIVNIIVPTKTSELTNDSGFLTTHQNISNLASKDELSATATAIVGAIPTKISDLTNDSSFITQADIDSKVDKASGKGLSTNDYTNADRSEVAKIANKQDKLVEGDNIEIKGNTISANLTNIAYSDLKSKPSINGVELVGNKTTADLKIDSGKVDGIKVNGVLATIKNRIAELTFPTKLSEFINDAGYLDAHQDLSDYAKKSDIPHNVSAFDNDAHYLTEHQDITWVQEKLVPGPGIVINNNLISATGEGGSGDSIQVTTLDDTALVGTIVQYIGPTTATITNGLFYKKESTGWVKATIENEVAGSFDVKNGNVYVTYKDPEGDRAGIMMGIRGGNAVVSTSGNTNSLLLDSLIVETQDDLKVNGHLYADQVYAPDGKNTIEINNDTLVDGKLTVNSGVVIFNDDETVVETGEQGHVYFKKGVTIGTDAEDKHKSLEVNGTVRIYGHDIYGHGAQFEESILADGTLTSLRGINSCGGTFLGDRNDPVNGNINFFPTYTEEILPNGRKRISNNDDAMAQMTIQRLSDGKKFPSLQMEDGRVVAKTLKCNVLDSASGGRIDVKTELHLDTVMETRKVEVKGGYPIIVYDYHGNQSVKLSSNGGAIFCGDIHCNGYADYKHDVDGINKLTANRYFRYYGGEAIEIGKYYYIGSFGAKGSKVTLPNDWRKYSKLAIVIAWGGTVYNNWKMNSTGDIKEVPTRFVADNGSMEIHTEFGDFYLNDYSKDVTFSSGDLAVYNAYLFGVG